MTKIHVIQTLADPANVNLKTMIWVANVISHISVYDVNFKTWSWVFQTRVSRTPAHLVVWWTSTLNLDTHAMKSQRLWARRSNLLCQTRIFVTTMAVKTLECVLRKMDKQNAGVNSTFTSKLCKKSYWLQWLFSKVYSLEWVWLGFFKRKKSEKTTCKVCLMGNSARVLIFIGVKMITAFRMERKSVASMQWIQALYVTVREDIVVTYAKIWTLCQSKTTNI